MAVIYTHLTLIFKARMTTAAGGEERRGADGTDAETRRRRGGERGRRYGEGSRSWLSSNGQAQARALSLGRLETSAACSSSSAAECE